MTSCRSSPIVLRRTPRPRRPASRSPRSACRWGRGRTSRRRRQSTSGKNSRRRLGPERDERRRPGARRRSRRSASRCRSDDVEQPHVPAKTASTHGLPAGQGLPKSLAAERRRLDPKVSSCADRPRPSRRRARRGRACPCSQAARAGRDEASATGGRRRSWRTPPPAPSAGTGTRPARHQGQRRRAPERAEGRDQLGHRHLAGPEERRLLGRDPQPQVPVGVLQADDRAVDQRADRQRQAGQRHHVDRVARGVQADDRRQDRDGSSARRSPSSATRPGTAGSPASRAPPRAPLPRPGSRSTGGRRPTGP